MQKSKSDLHAGHRKRTREALFADGIPEGTPDHKVLEMLLFHSIPRRDTNELAHELLNEFGSISSVLDASPEELMKIKGVGQNTVSLLKIIMPVARAYLNDKKDNKSVMKYENIFEYIINKYCGFNEEIVAITSFNNRGALIDFDIIGKGDISEVSVSIRKVMETVIKRNASAVVLSHNHPNGNAVPSGQDIETTKRLAAALSNINVRLIDHIIVADDDCVSMLQTSNLTSIFDY